MSYSANVCREIYNRTLACSVWMGSGEMMNSSPYCQQTRLTHGNKSVFLCVTHKIYIDDKNIKTYARNDSHCRNSIIIIQNILVSYTDCCTHACRRGFRRLCRTDARQVPSGDFSYFFCLFVYYKIPYTDTAACRALRCRENPII